MRAIRRAAAASFLVVGGGSAAELATNFNHYFWAILMGASFGLAIAVLDKP